MASYAGLQVWRETKDKWKKIARHFNKPMTIFLDGLADQIIKAHNINGEEELPNINILTPKSEKPAEKQNPNITTGEV